MANKQDLTFETSKYIYNFQQFEAFFERSFVKNIL